MTGGADLLTHDPWTGAVVHAGRSAGPETVDDALARSTGGARGWARTPVTERADTLRAVASALRADADALSELIVAEVGKLRADAEAEVEWTARTAEYYAEHPPPVGHAGGARVFGRPLGVVAAITPWNVPLVTPAWKWLPALMAGDAVVWKPSELATAVAVAAHARLLAAGVPPDVIVLVPGGPEVARALCADHRVAGVHFTGSEAAGRAIASALAPRLGRYALELSGLNPALVFADADLDRAADCIVGCATALAGQKCTATRRVIVDRRVQDELLDRLAERFGALRPGDPRAAGTTLGPLITAAATAGAEAQVAAAVERGARLVARSPAGVAGPGGTPPARAALLAGLEPEDPLRTRELFAPVVCVEAFADPEDAWRQADATPYGLSASVFTGDAARLAEAPERLRAGVVALNRRGDDVALQAPFGGHKRSGNGQPEGGEWVYGALTETQAVYGPAP